MQTKEPEQLLRVHRARGDRERVTRPRRGRAVIRLEHRLHHRSRQRFPTAKVGILSGSFVAGALGFFLVRLGTAANEPPAKDEKAKPPVPKRPEPVDRAKLASILLTSAAGRETVTVEGVAEGGVLHPVQEAKVSQCGYRALGFIVSLFASK